MPIGHRMNRVLGKTVNPGIEIRFAVEFRLLPQRGYMSIHCWKEQEALGQTTH